MLFFVEVTANEPEEMRGMPSLEVFRRYCTKAFYLLGLLMDCRDQGII